MSLSRGRFGSSASESNPHLCFTLDERAAAVANGRGALDVARGETFVKLCQGDRLMELGCSRLVDYAYERRGSARRCTPQRGKPQSRGGAKPGSAMSQ